MDSPTNKYKSFKPINIKDRNWPNQVISDSPDWCSVDLRDGNQALIEPMGAERKIECSNCSVILDLKR